MKQVFPTANDVGGNGAGRVMGEKTLQKMMEVLTGGQSFVLTGFAVTSPSGLDISVAAGEAFVDGRLVLTDEPLTATLGANTFYWIYLEVVEDVNGLATDVALDVVEDSGGSGRFQTPVPAGRAVLAYINTGASTIQNIDPEHRGPPGGSQASTYRGDGTATRFINLGRTPSLVLVSGSRSGEGTEVFGLGALAGSPGRDFDAVTRLGLYFHERSTSETFAELVTTSKSFDPPNITPGSFHEETITLTGVASTWPLFPFFSNLDIEVFMTAFRSGTDTVTVRFSNTSSSDVNMPSGTLRVNAVAPKTLLKRPTWDFDGSGTGKFAPYIVPGGFQVDTDATLTGEHLNVAAKKYDWIAIF